MKFVFSNFETVVMKCPFKADLFPFDTQVCELIYRSDSHNADEMSVQLVSSDDPTTTDFAPSAANYQPHSGNCN